MDLGFIKAGHKIVWANDFDKYAVETYKYNIDKNIVYEDIKNISIKNIPDGDIVIGGFPCQGFSIANINRNERDERNFLYLELLRVIEGKKPLYFLAENVPGIISLGKGKILNLILKDMERLGYKVKYKILNAADYGVPQLRKRVIFLGIRNDLDIYINYPKPMYFENKEPYWRTVRDAIGDLPLEPTQIIPNHIGTKHKVVLNNYIGNRPTQWDKPSPTILGRGGGTGGPVIIPHPNLHRRMTVRETARIQTFPDEFIFQGSMSAQYRQIGNAVPVLMAYYLGRMFPV